MSKQVKVDIELESGRKLTHCMNLSIHQEMEGHHAFEIVFPFEILEDSREIFFSKSYDAVVGK